MKTTIAILSMGEMGSGVGRALVQGGARVITTLAGRSQASVDRAAKAGVEVVLDDKTLVAQADFVLSIVPPARALELAERLLPLIRLAPQKPVFVDCNAVAPATVAQIAAPFHAEGLPFVDAAIFGWPPAPWFYASGKIVSRFEELRAFGITVRPLSDEIGAASALKMAYSGINKGLQAAATALISAAAQAGVSEALKLELQDSQPDILRPLVRSLPKMPGKAYRWVGEMEEIAKFADTQPGAAEIFNGAARLFESIAAEYAGEKAGQKQIARIAEFLAQAEPVSK